VAFAVVVALLFYVGSHLPFGAPRASESDERAVARSGAVATAATAATRRDDALLDGVSVAVHGGRVGADAVDDACEGIDGPAEKGTVECRRWADRYLAGTGTGTGAGAHTGARALDSAVRAALLAVDRELRSRGWSSENGAPGTPLPLPTGTQPTGLQYEDGHGGLLTVYWSTAGIGDPLPGGTPEPSPYDPPDRDGRSRGLPGARGSTPGPSAASIADAYAHHLFLLHVQLSDRYWDGTTDDI
jgi:hypothetical protein